MTEIALAKKPFDVAVTRGADMLAAQRRPLFPVPLGVRHVALLAMFAVQKRAGRDRVGPVGQRVGPDVVSGRDMIPKRIGYSAGQGTRSDGHNQNRNG